MVQEIDEKNEFLDRFTRDAVVVVQDESVVYWNRNYEKLTNFSKNEIREKNFFDLVVPEDLARLKEFHGKRVEDRRDEGPREVDVIVRPGKRLSIEVTSFSVQHRGRPAWVEVMRDVTEVKNLRRELKRNQEVLDAILDISPVGIGSTHDRVLEWANDAFYRMMGYEKGALQGASTRVFYTDPGEFERVGRFMNDKLEKEGRGKAETEMVRKDGAVIKCRVQACSLGEQRAIQNNVISAIADITIVDKLEQELEDARCRLNLATELGCMVFWVATPDWGAMVYMSPSVEKISGVPCDYFYRNPRAWLDIIHPDDRERVEKGLIEHDEESKELEYRILRPDGSARWIKNIISPVRGKKGGPNFLSGLAQDLTENRHDEEIVRYELERYRVLVDESPLGISIIGKDGRFLYVNQKFVDLFGYALDETPTLESWLQKAYPDPIYRNEVISPWFKCISIPRAGKTRTKTFSATCKDGSEKVIRFRNATMASGRCSIIYEDVTEQKMLEFQLLQAQKLEAIGTLASGIAHDFNNILGAIIGYAELFQLTLDPDQRDALHGVENILKAGHRAKDLVKQILAFSRQGEPGLKPVKVGIIVEEALKLLRATLPATIAIRKYISADQDLVMGDPTKIHQVLMNLCTNALHAMKETGGVLEVSLSNVVFDSETAAEWSGVKPGLYVNLAVRDTGSGMGAAVLDRIFDPYFTTREKGLGTGLGLSVVHGIVKNHGGAISVQSEPRKGSIFNVFFPVIEGEEGAESLSPDEIPGGDERILFVDDEEALADLGMRMLQHLGYNVSVRTSSIEALEAFRAHPDRFDLVITDMAMPNMSGDRLAKEIMQIRPDIPIILCTGYSELITADKAAEMGMGGFVMKPLVMRDLASIIRTVLDA